MHSTDPDPTSPAAKPHRTAIVYDFDGTLAEGNIQEHAFLKELKIAPKDFWDEVKKVKQQNDADEILTYMRLMLVHANEASIPVTRELLRKQGGATPMFSGLDTWFSRINKYASDRNLDLEHYVISAGIDELIAGTPIASQFRKIFASSFVYDEHGVAVWPAVVINYTTKTQFLFRINKGVDNCWDNTLINTWVPRNERPIPFSRILFIGDGETDIPSMKLARQQGGYSVAVFDPKKWSNEASQRNIYRLISEDRCNFVAPADYSEGTQLEVTVKGILGRFARDTGYRGHE